MIKYNILNNNKTIRESFLFPLKPLKFTLSFNTRRDTIDFYCFENLY